MVCLSLRKALSLGEIKVDGVTGTDGLRSPRVKRVLWAVCACAKSCLVWCTRKEENEMEKKRSRKKGRKKKRWQKEK